uniref:NADH dehydrogenase subunit 6 n=1 Tax=Auricularia villosula TaxID=1579976 RepID=UPI002079BF08|nr:NADH dehydrogenase subunit 6 [Auricularia villosula]URP31169.1 NADH dehydrogenase subunit 6 [Auricularia villosula]
MNNFLLDVLSFGAILSSILVITSKNPVVAVIFLISLFINTAGYLILLGIGFIGISYIIIYIGAITVLFLFIIMMINIRLLDILEIGNEYTKNLPLALLVGTLFVYEIFNVLPFTINNVFILDLPLEILNFFNALFLEKSLDLSTFINITHVDHLTMTPLKEGVETMSNLKTSGLSKGLVESILYNSYEKVLLNNPFKAETDISVANYISEKFNLEYDYSPIYNIENISNIYFNNLTNLSNFFHSAPNVIEIQSGNTDIDNILSSFLQIEVIGQGLYTYGAMWLLLSSIILLLSMVSAIFLSKNLSENFLTSAKKNSTYSLRSTKN